MEPDISKAAIAIMTLSNSEPVGAFCSACGQNFTVDVWTLVDAEERPDLAEALLEGVLHTVACPHCQTSQQVVAPLLLHDPANRRVYFAAPPDWPEYQLREQAQALLYRLMAGIPEERHFPYLGDVQVEQGIDGVRRAMIRRQRAKARLQAEAQGQSLPTAQPTLPKRKAAPTPPPPPPRTEAPEPQPSSELFDAVQQLMGANSIEEFREIIAERPVLQTTAADLLLARLADEAAEQGDSGLASALHEVRLQLARQLRSAPSDGSLAADTSASTADLSLAQGPLSQAAYQTLMTVSSVDELRLALGEQPALLEPWADDDLLLRTESALDEGDERLAFELEERREALAELRNELMSAAMLAKANRALLDAEGEEEVADVLARYPALLTSAAQASLRQLAAEAQQRGDERLAMSAEQRRQMLLTVRLGLDAA
jgi:hypothetical protein